MNRLGRVAPLTLLVAVAGCGGSSQSDLERAVQRELQRQIDADDASGRKVLHVTCSGESSVCMARVQTRAGDRFTAVKIDQSSDDVSVGNRVDQGSVRPGPLEEGVKRDLQAALETDGRGGEVVEVICDRDRSQCRARIHDDGGDRFMGVLVGLDDSDDYSIVTTWEE